jgi:anti-anti-sigma factor
MSYAVGSAQRGVVQVTLSGVIDLVSHASLAMAADQVAAATPETVVVDLAAVTFACSSLANFIARLHRMLPDAALTVCHCSPMADRIFAATDVEQFIACHDHPSPLEHRQRPVEVPAQRQH